MFIWGYVKNTKKKKNHFCYLQREPLTSFVTYQKKKIFLPATFRYTLNYSSILRAKEVFKNTFNPIVP